VFLVVLLFYFFSVPRLVYYSKTSHTPGEGVTGKWSMHFLILFHGLFANRVMVTWRKCLESAKGKESVKPTQTKMTSR
jgi:hypothetical protein